MSRDLKSWTEEKKSWVFVLNDLFEQMFGTNFLTYCFDKDHGTKVDVSKKCEIFEYYHEYWEKHFSRESPEPQDDTKHLCHPRIHLNSHANIHPQQPAPKRIKFDSLDSTSSSIYQPSTSELNFAEMLEAQDDSTHIKSSQTSLKLVSDTSVVVGDDNVPKMPQQCALRAAMAKQSRTSL